ncbi:hypothetical protein [Cupriavidus basilensis]
MSKKNQAKNKGLKSRFRRGFFFEQKEFAGRGRVYCRAAMVF